MIRRNMVKESLRFVKNLKDGREFLGRCRGENFRVEKRDRKTFFVIIIVIHQVRTTLEFVFEEGISFFCKYHYS